MSRIKTRFDRLQGQGRKALISYFTAGDPNPNVTVPMMRRLVAAGADVLELGMPFSDPMADGPVIQKASERALAAGMTLRGVLDCVREFRQNDDDTPVVLMGYLNPIEAMGHREFAEAAANAGVDGVLTVDLPLEEARELTPDLVDAGIDPIFLLAPTSTAERMARTAQLGRGYVYYVSLKGITGSAALNVDEVAAKMAAIKQHITIPVGVGFGIKDAASAAAIAKTADAVVVGSAIVALMAEHKDAESRMFDEVSALVSAMRAAMDEGAR